MEAEARGGSALSSASLQGGAMQQPKAKARNNLLGIAAVVGAGIAMMSSDACMRGAIRELPLGEAITGRGTLTCLFLTIAAAASATMRWHPGLLSVPMAVRVLAEVGAGLCFNTALQKMPIADASAVLQFIPIVTTVAAAGLFAERVGWQRWLAAIAGLVGVLLILKPGTDGFTPWSLMAVAAMFCMSTRDLATSRIDPSIPTLPIGALPVLPPVFPVWHFCLPLRGWHRARPRRGSCSLLLF